MCSGNDRSKEERNHSGCNNIQPYRSREAYYRSPGKLIFFLILRGKCKRKHLNRSIGTIMQVAWGRLCRTGFNSLLEPVPNWEGHGTCRASLSPTSSSLSSFVMTRHIGVRTPYGQKPFQTAQFDGGRDGIFVNLPNPPCPLSLNPLQWEGWHSPHHLCHIRRLWTGMAVARQPWKDGMWIQK